jgi:hypothetical protein
MNSVNGRSNTSRTGIVALHGVRRVLRGQPPVVALFLAGTEACPYKKPIDYPLKWA